MPKGIVLYTSKYGSALNYAKMLAEACAFDLLDLTKCHISKLKAYDTIIYGAGIYAGKIKNINFLLKHLTALKDKKIIIFAVGITPNDAKWLNTIKQRNLKGYDLPLYYCRGNFDMNKLSIFDHFLCSALAKQIAKKAPETYEPWEKALLESIKANTNHISYDYLVPILEKIHDQTVS